MLLWYDVLLRSEEGDPDGALLACRRLLNLARSLGDEPLLVSQSVRSRGSCEAARAVQRVLAQGEPSGALLADMQRRLEEEAVHPGGLIGARGDRPCVDGLMELIQSGEVSWSQARRYLREYGEKETEAEALEAFLFSVLPGSEKANRAALLRYLNRFVEAAQRPVEEQQAAFRELEQERKDLPVMARPLAPRGVAWADNLCRHRTALRSAAAALAAERFRRDHGRWPESLEEMVPHYLDRVPLDPADGMSLRYRRLPDGVVIYGLGADRVDNGGEVHVLPKVEGPARDEGFRLWDVAQRRQPPREANRQLVPPDARDGGKP
jgi:hypothetical protein